MTAFLATYHPIISTSHGRTAVQTFGIAPFVDASCRREPDFESQFPAISALCRGKLFAPRLNPDDLVAYITTKGKYEAIPRHHWRLVAILRVLRRFETHIDAAAWYGAQGVPLPKNCIVEGNPPLPLEQTGGTNQFGDRNDPDRVVRRWNAAYRARASECGVMLATEPVLLELQTPAVISDQDLRIFGGRMPGTQNPPRIRPEVIARLLDHATRRNAA